MGDFRDSISFSRSGLSEVSEGYDKVLKRIEETVLYVKKEADTLGEKWKGANSEKIQPLFKKTSDSLDAIEDDLKRVSSFVTTKADQFNQLKI